MAVGWVISQQTEHWGFMYEWGMNVAITVLCTIPALSLIALAMLLPWCWKNRKRVYLFGCLPAAFYVLHVALIILIYRSGGFAGMWCIKCDNYVFEFNVLNLLCVFAARGTFLIWMILIISFELCEWRHRRDNGCQPKKEDGGSTDRDTPTTIDDSQAL